MPQELRDYWRGLLYVVEESLGVELAALVRISPDPDTCSVVARGASQIEFLTEGQVLPRSQGCLCHSVLEQGGGLAISDGREDERFMASALVAEGLLAYLGVPIYWPDGRPFGTLCAMHREVREWTEADRRMMNTLRGATEARLALFQEQVRLEAVTHRADELAEDVRVLEMGLERAVFESTDDCIFVWDNRYRYLYLNRSALEYQAYVRRADAVGRPLDALGLAPEIVDTWKSRIDEVFATERPLEVIDYADFGAGPAHSESLLSPVRNGSGEVFAVSALYRDVTDRRLLEEAIEARERHFSSVFESMPIPALLTSRDHQVIALNPEFTRVFGYELTDVGARVGWRDLLCPNRDDYRVATERFGDAMDRAIDEQRVATDPVELIVTCKSGRKRIVSGSMSFADERNLVMLADLTELREREIERARLFTVIEQSPENIVITDAHGRVQYVNPAFEALSGYTESEVLGKWLSILKSGAHDEEFYRDLWRTLKAGQVWTGRFLNRAKSGKTYSVRGTIAPVRDTEGEIVAFASVMRDTTELERREARDEERRRMEALGTLAGGIAHDFNNLLGAILGFTQLLQEDVETISSGQSHLDEIVAATRRAKDLVAQIRTFGERRGPAFASTSLSALVSEGAEHLKAGAPPGVQVEFDGPETAFVRADPSQLHQVVMNLGTNGMYAMRERGGTLTLRLGSETRGEPATRYHVVSVSDVGGGIPEDVREHIFEPYFSTKPQGDGSGLGLAIVHGLVKSHGGFIEVESEPGRTEFRVFLPATEPDAVEAPDERTGDRLHGAERIAVIDDEEMLTRLARRGLGRLGYEVVAFNDPVEALEIFRSSPSDWDAMVTDLTMPGLDGLSLAQAILDARPGMPVVLTTGYLDDDDETRARDVGIRSFLAKPAPIEELARALRAQFDAAP